MHKITDLKTLFLICIRTLISKLIPWQTCGWRVRVRVENMIFLELIYSLYSLKENYSALKDKLLFRLIFKLLKKYWFTRWFDILYGNNQWLIPGPHLHVELSFGKILNKLLLMAFSLVRVSEWLCIGRAVSLVMSRLEPCMAASAVSIWMCVWLSKCDKCCKFDDLLDKCFMFVTTDHKIHEFSLKEQETEKHLFRQLY